MRIFCFILFGFFGLAAMFLVVDCSAGKTRYLECSVRDHHYVAPWTETRVSTDDEGHVHIDTTRHPEEFHVICSELQGANVIDCHTSSSLYHSVTNSQIVTVRTRQGRWTGGQYLPCLQP